MHSLDIQSRFLELRAKGWSLARIATKLKVAQRTLVDWNARHRAQAGRWDGHAGVGSEQGGA